jgi:cell wall assembly regulator SMI1
MTDADAAALREAWNRFAACVAERAPAGHAALRAPATAEQIAALESALGFALHGALRALLERHDGAEEVLPAAFLPLSYRLATAAEIAEEHRTLVSYADEHPDEEEADRVRWWVPFGLPWCEGTGLAFVDHRPGPTYGAVCEYGAGRDLSGPAPWGADLAGFFTALADAVRTGEPFLDHWPVREESASGQPCLGWDERD